MPTEALIQRVAVCAVAVFGAIVYARWDACQPRGATGALSRFVVAPVALAVAVVVALGVVPPVVAYGILCLAFSSVYLLREEHARRRRVASLAPRPAIDAVAAIWIGCAAASPLMLTPYVLFAQQRVAALIVAACALVMAAIAWRVSSAPEQLAGADIQRERIGERAWRLRRAGITAVLAIGIVFVFTSFVNAELPVVLPIQRLFNLGSLAAWAVLWAWVTWYVHQLDRLSCSTSS